MSSATIRWIKGKQFIGTDSTNHSVVLSTPDEGIGMKPSELLLVALGSCTAVDVVEILRKKRKPVSSLEIKLSADQDDEPPWTFRDITIKFIIAGENISSEDVQKAIELSEEKYCSVASTIKGRTTITTDFEII